MEKESYCPPDLPLSNPWVDHGINPCFLETITSSITLIFTILIVAFQLFIYKKYSTPVDDRLLPKAGCLYTMQVTMFLVLSVEAVAHFIIQATFLYSKNVYGYQGLTFSCGVITWPSLLVLVCYERHRLLPSPPAWGHGIALISLIALAFVFQALSVLGWHSPHYFFLLRNVSDNVALGLYVLRCSATLAVLWLTVQAPGLVTHLSFSDREQQQALINEEGRSGEEAEGEGAPSSASEGTTWRGVWRKIKKLWSYMWPRKSPILKIRVLFCLLLLLAGRGLNVLVPLYYKYIVDSLTPGEEKTLKWRYDLILIYCGIKLLQGSDGSGLLDNARSLLWIRVQQFTSREIQVRLFDHLHGLSLRWHLSRKTGEVLRVMDRGTTSINSLLSYILFEIAPTIVDIIVAVVYFCLAFNIWFGVIVFVAMATYLAVTIVITEWRTKYRRDMNTKDNKTRAIGVDSLLNFETVKYYNAEDTEVNRYQEAILDYQKSEWLSLFSLSLLNGSQIVVMTLGLLAGTLFCAYKVVHEAGILTVGDFVLFITYINQLYVPLNWLGSYYRLIQQSFIDMENMFDLLDEKREATRSLHHAAAALFTFIV